MQMGKKDQCNHIVYFDEMKGGKRNIKKGGEKDAKYIK